MEARRQTFEQLSGSGKPIENKVTAPSGPPTPGMRQLATEIVIEHETSGERIRRIASDVYLDAERFANEQTRLFRRLPVPIAPAALLHTAGQSVTHDAYGVPLIITRDQDRNVHVFLNVCRHRGTRLIESTDVTDGSRIVCPYHAWTYNLDGSLRGLPRPESFPGLEKSDYGLLRLPAAEAGGMIWTKLDGGELGIEAYLGELAADFDAIGIGASHLYRRNTHDVAANWKLIMDAFLESYHVQRLHRSTIAPYFADSITASDRVGIHFRNAVGRVEFVRAKELDDLSELRQVVTYSYSLLPGMVVVVSPDYINIMQLYPQAVDRTLVEDFMLIADPPDDADVEDHWARSFELLDGDVFGGEDFRAATLGQQGLATGAIDELTLGTAEVGVADFHAELECLLESSDQNFPRSQIRSAP